MTTLSAPLKRVKRKVKACQNPLFEKWLKEWKEEAVKNGSDTQYCLNKALKSLQKFPVKLSSGKECMMLENFGEKICKMLDKRLEEYKTSHPEDLTLQMEIDGRNGRISDLGIDLKLGRDSKSKDAVKNTNKRKSSEMSSDKDSEAGKEPDVGKSKKSEYMPMYRSGAYAILIAMLQKTQEDNFKGFLTKSELQNYAQDFCDSSFTKPLPGSYFTAWSSMGVLIRKNFVQKEGNPAKFSLTEKGVDLAIKLKLAGDTSPVANGQVKQIPESLIVSSPSPVKNSQPKKIKKVSVSQTLPDEGGTKKHKTLSSPSKDKDNNVLKPSSQEEEVESSSEPDETIFLLPGSFEIRLLVDLQERDNKYEQVNSSTMRELKSRNVNFEIRHLKVGDFIWIAKDLNSGAELVLPYIVERKRMDDLASSIKDGRFHEQKFRLKQSGIENLIYLVEKYGNENQRLGLPMPTLQQAISNTQIVGGFMVRVTNNHDHSMRYLNFMTVHLNNIFKTKTLMSCKKSNLSPINFSDDLIPLMTFKDFNKGSEKNKKLTVRDMLVKHLLQLNGISVEKAKAIVQLYPTPKSLMDALKQPNGEKSIANLTFGGLNRSIGTVIAKQIQMLYTSLDLR